MSRNPEPRVERAPPARPDEDVATVLIQETIVQTRNLASDFGAPRSIEPSNVDNHDVVKIANHSMAEHLRALADELGRRDVPDLELFGLPAQDERSDLKHSHFPPFVGRDGESHRELDLDRGSHAPGRKVEKKLESPRERNHSIAQHRRESHDSRPRARDSVVERIVFRRVCRRDVLERSVVLGKTELVGANALVGDCSELGRIIGHVEGIELTLVVP
jgi:hypothetical protein